MRAVMSAFRRGFQLADVVGQFRQPQQPAALVQQRVHLVHIQSAHAHDVQQRPGIDIAGAGPHPRVLPAGSCPYWCLH